MKCPECREEMFEILPAQVQLQPVQNEGEIYPSKIVVLLYHIFTCKECGIKASRVESKEYKVCICNPILDVENKELKPE